MDHDAMSIEGTLRQSSVAQEDEAALVERAKARCPEAWTEIYDAHYPAIYRYIRARIFDEAAAEDLASAVFVAALKGIDSYRHQGRPLLAWLYRIARNQVVSHQRRLYQRPGPDSGRGVGLPRRVLGYLSRLSRADGTLRLDSGQELLASSDGGLESAVDRLDLRDALRRLTEQQREVLLLRFFAGLSTPEIARAMGKDPAALYSLEARALLALRRHLREGAKESSPPSDEFRLSRR